LTIHSRAIEKTKGKESVPSWTIFPILDEVTQNDFD
jgi:hypothetical protein